MEVRIVRESAVCLAEYAGTSIAFTVTSRYLLEEVVAGPDRWTLLEEKVHPYVKDYDALPGEGPLRWQACFDLSNWGFFGAFDGRRRAGGAAVAWNTPGVVDLEGRDDVAVLWDIRVHPKYRGRGVGHRLFAAALAWARERNCNQLKVETQNINVPACKFYARQGCTLTEIDRMAYGPELEETQMWWALQL